MNKGIFGDSIHHFFRGMAIIFDFRGALLSDFPEEKSDAEALRSDWEAIGQDFRTVMDDWEKIQKVSNDE